MRPRCICLMLALLTLPLLASSAWAGSAAGVWDSAGRLFTLPNPPVRSPGSRSDTADVAIENTTAYPGTEGHLVGFLVKSPVQVTAFEFYITMSRPDLVNFSTVRIYTDSMDTCPGSEPPCWVYYVIRECLAEPGTLIEDWNTFLPWGEVGDTTQPDCTYLRVLAWDLLRPIPPQPEYATLFQFGLDVLCLPDSLSDRTVYFFVTGQISDADGYLVPFRAHYGELTVLQSVPGDASNDSLVDVEDVVFLLNYLYKNGPEPCVMEAADPNADCVVDLGDLVYLLNFLFKGGPSPEFGCAH